jgi:uncharacterized protein
MLSRTINLKKHHHSLFLFGPRQTGKTCLINNTLSPDIFINLLKHDEFLRYARDVSLLSKEAKALKRSKALIVIDEIQRCPELLNEVQLIMQDRPGFQFIMTGSSARKLKRTGINLLGGRAITLHLYPFTHEELGKDFSLDEAMRFGTLPKISLEKDKQDKARLLKSYIETYLQEEIQQESLTRNVPSFSAFLELAAHENQNLLNFQGLAREVGVHSKTIKEYFHILEDTLIGFLLYPYKKSHRTKIVSHPKFYFFDCGIVSALKNSLGMELASGTPPFGRAFEHFMVIETKRLMDYYEIPARLSFFRTTDGAEVDLILEFENQIWAIEIKASKAPQSSRVRGLKSFIKDHQHARALCVCLTPRVFIEDNIEFLPWQDFMELLKKKGRKQLLPQSLRGASATKQS